MWVKIEVRLRSFASSSRAWSLRSLIKALSLAYSRNRSVRESKVYNDDSECIDSSCTMVLYTGETQCICSPMHSPILTKIL